MSVVIDIVSLYQKILCDQTTKTGTMECNNKRRLEIWDGAFSVSNPSGKKKLDTDGISML